ncbi:MAG: hypothetical protein COY58_08510 [Gammaproteobacteria bacterium CG_4_10_14_0_8_um_filter_38_16]|nr:MAG: hypothetical protein COY58_08510 [Gammaproteobacteria bacterium CG_4_10_14_0_8_um_filter_38_16]PJA03580.1 MAG: hypothetical protein COX72_04425 [Gammaproteobacteria bacterium CG_4_10_14_0_2_um_filter_38_22]PJB10256.1 MAG: hypothetical protein CO120_05795 [Gammaproteobacteria bacterium CG_4_9_14_3_um_filter_38_9]
MSKKMIGKTLALAAALTFAAAPMTASMAADMGHVKCVGGNSCKGMSVCKTAHNKCKAMNSCKGKGLAMVHSKKECAKMKKDAMKMDKM